MPLMFSLGQHSALDAVISRLEEGEHSFACLDDLYVMCDPGRVAEVHSILEEELWKHARIQIHQEASARMMDPPTPSCGEAMVTSQTQSLKIMGCPVGHPDFVQDQLSKLSDRHDILLGRVHCATARANFFLRPDSTGQISTFASHRDDQMWACLCTLLGIDPASVTRCEVATRGSLGKLGGLHSDGSPEPPHRGPHHH